MLPDGMTLLAEEAFVDANIPMYAAGSSHPLRDPCIQILRASLDSSGGCVSSAEVLQEIFNVYLRQSDLSRGREILSTFAEALHGNVVDVLAADIQAAAALDVSPRLQARDRVHLTVMQRLGVSRVISSDRAFDEVPSIQRLDPLAFATWRDDVFAPAQR
jgi:predicted nucleic acid-binding protein